MFVIVKQVRYKLIHTSDKILKIKKMFFEKIFYYNNMLIFYSIQCQQGPVLDFKKSSQ